LLRLFAPLLPFVTEEVWSWWHGDSVHANPWPDAEALRAAAAGTDPAISDAAAALLSEIRKAKTEAKKSLIAPVSHVVVTDTAARLALAAPCFDDLRAAGRVTGAIDTVEGPTLAVAVTLAD
jgi:valyl-tRNA synthetase